MTERSDKLSVIGRLDEQVEAVLITPIKKGQTPDEEPREQSNVPAPATEERTAKLSQAEREVDSALPIWLL